MNTLLRSSFRSIRSLTNIPFLGKREFTRTITHLVNRNDFTKVINIHQPSLNCKCGCAGLSKLHTKGKKFHIDF